MSLSAIPLNLAESNKTLYSINKEMKDVLKYILKNASQDDARPTLQCINITKKIFEVTNGFTIVQIVFKKEQEFFPDGVWDMKILGDDKLLVENCTGIGVFPDTRALFKYEEIDKRGMYLGENIFEGSRGFAKISFDARLMTNVLSMKGASVTRFYLSSFILMQIATDSDCEYDIYVCLMPMHPGDDENIPSYASKNNGAYIKVTSIPEKEEEKPG